MLRAFFDRLRLSFVDNATLTGQFPSSMAKKKVDLFGDEDETQNSDFEQALEAYSGRASRALRVGDPVTVQILTLGKEEVFVSTGTPVDGVIRRSDLLNSKGEMEFKVGDHVEAVVLKVKGSDVLLGRRGKLSNAEMDNLEDAFDMQIPVPGRVLESTKGGFRVEIQGNKRAFCPISQIDSNFVSDPLPYVGKSYEFLVTKMDERGLVVSRRKVLELRRAEGEGDFLQNIRVGDLVDGTVTRLEPFGAFVDLGAGVEGLIHISELSWQRITHPSDVVQPTLAVRVKVLKIAEEGDRLKISLSLKQGGSEADPWTLVEQEFPVGKTVMGTVEKRETFGLFVALGKGITGLLPRSAWKESLEPGNFENKKKGDTLLVRVVSMQPAERRLSLGLPQDGDDGSWREHQPKSSGLGTFGDLLKASAARPPRKSFSK